MSVLAVILVVGVLYTLSVSLDNMGLHSSSTNIIALLLLGGVASIFAPVLAIPTLALALFYYYKVKI
jgi:hypothetical protein